MGGRRGIFAPGVLVSVVLAGGLTLGALSDGAVVGAQTVGRVSVATDGTQANDHTDGNGGGVAISADGRFIAFAAYATNLASGCGRSATVINKADVFVHDRLTRTTVCASLAPDGITPGNFSSGRPTLSADGRLLAFDSVATNLVTGGTTGSQVFVRDLLTGTTSLGSVASDGTPVGGVRPVLSPDGRVLAFTTSQVLVRDLGAGTTAVASVAPDGTTPANGGGAFASALSADGRVVAFVSEATNLDPRCPNGVSNLGHVYVRDLSAGITTCVSVAPDGTTPGNAGSGDASLSANGRVVSFSSRATNLVPPPVLRIDTYVRDLAAGVTTRVSVASDGTLGNNIFGGSGSQLSADSRFVAFASGATNLAPVDTNNLPDLLLRDRFLGTTRRVSLAADGAEANSYLSSFALSADGRVAAFISEATNLVPGDTNGVTDVFVVESALFTGGVFVASGELSGAAGAEIIVGAGAGGEPYVRSFRPDGTPGLTGFFAYPGGFRGGVRVAACDFDGDGRAEIVTGAGPGGGPHVRVLKLDAAGAVIGPLADFFAYDAAFRGGVFVACGDVDGDGVPELVTGAGAGGGPHVRVLKLQAGAPGGVVAFRDFFAYADGFAGGVRVAAGNVDGTDRASIIVGAGPGGGPHVRVIKLVNGVVTDTGVSFFAYPAAFAGGVFVGAGRVTDPGQADIVTGADAGGGPHVKVFRVAGGAPGGAVEASGFFAYTSAFTGGVRVATGDLDGAGLAEIVTGAGPGGGPHVRGFTGTGTPSGPSFMAY